MDHYDHIDDDDGLNIFPPFHYRHDRMGHEMRNSRNTSNNMNASNIMIASGSKEPRNTCLSMKMTE